MSRRERPGQSAENWKERQDALAEERARKFLADLNERQDKLKPRDLNDALAELVHNAGDLAKYLGAKDTETQQTTGVPSDHDAVVTAHHGLAGDLGLPSAFLVFSVVQGLTKAAAFANSQIDALGEKHVEEIVSSLAKAWDQFKDSTEQIIEDVKQQITELASLEKTDQAPIERSDATGQPDAGLRTQDKVRPDAPDTEMTALQNDQAKERADQAVQGTERKQETSVEIGGAKVDAEIAEVRKLQDAQEKVRDDQAAYAAERRTQLAEKYAGSPEQEKHLTKFDKAAKAADETLVRQQDAELQKLQEQQLQRSIPPDPNRDR
jgi:hypothetical protein